MSEDWYCPTTVGEIYPALQLFDGSLFVCLRNDYRAAIKRRVHDACTEPIVLTVNKQARASRPMPVLSYLGACFPFEGAASCFWAREFSSRSVGTKLGPILFILMINDFVTSCESIRYVDDTTIISCGSVSQPDNIQKASSESFAWANIINMKSNPKKSKALLVSFSRNRPAIPEIIINNCPITRVDSLKLLGVTNWVTHFNDIYGKSCSRIHFVKLLKRAQVPTNDVLKFLCNCCTTDFRVLLSALTPWPFQATSIQIGNFTKTYFKMPVSHPILF